MLTYGSVVIILIVFFEAFLIFNLHVMGLASLCTWVERKGSALIQDRVGANRAGAFWETDILLLKPVFFVIRWLGILGVINTLVCDGVKALMKEDFVPEGTSKFLHALAPFMAVLPIFVAFAVVPLWPQFELFGYVVTPALAPINAGILFVLAMGSVSVYGVALAGWTANNKFSMLGGLRAAAQMMSYELAMGIAMATMIIVYDTLDLNGMILAQAHLWQWGIFQQPIAFVILFVVGMAETKRGPFDLPESESELVAGYFTEYSGMKFLIFWLGEFAEIALFSMIMAVLFFGGWQVPMLMGEGVHAMTLWGFNAAGSALGWQAVAQLPYADIWAALGGHIAFVTKVVVLSVLQIVIRWTLPRFRYDQLMHLGWKILLPLSMVNLMATAAAVVNW